MALMESLSVVEGFETPEHYDYSYPMDYFEALSHCGDDNEEDEVFLDDGHVWFSLYLDEIVSKPF